MTTLLALSWALLLATPLVIWEAWVLLKLWGWYIVPLGLAPLGLPHAVGISVTVGLITHQYSHKHDDEGWNRIAQLVLFPALSLVIGWIAHFWMKP